MIVHDAGTLGGYSVLVWVGAGNGLVYVVEGTTRQEGETRGARKGPSTYFFSPWAPVSPSPTHVASASTILNSFLAQAEHSLGFSFSSVAISNAVPLTRKCTGTILNDLASFTTLGDGWMGQVVLLHGIQDEQKG